MSLTRKSLLISFLSTLLLTLFVPAVLPGLQMQFFIPFLIIAFYQKSLLQSLWLALSCGMILDLFSSHEHFGLYPLNFFLTTVLIFGNRKHFFADSLSTLPIMTYTFSVISTALQTLLLHFFEKPIILSWSWVIIDLFLMPSFDATFGFIWFIMPSLLFGSPIRRGHEYFN